MKTLIVGLGNPILCDDGVGIQAASIIAARNCFPDVTVTETTRAGLDFIDLITGFDRVILIDAIVTDRGKPGDIYRLKLEDLQPTLHSAAPHDIDLSSAVMLGKKLGGAMPEEIVIYGIEVQDIYTFSETCTPEVSAAIPECVDRVFAELVKSN